MRKKRAARKVRAADILSLIEVASQRVNYDELPVSPDDSFDGMTDSTAPTTTPAVVATTFVTVPTAAPVFSLKAPAFSLTRPMTFFAFFTGFFMRANMPRDDFFAADFLVAFFAVFLADFFALFTDLPRPVFFAVLVVRFVDFLAISSAPCIDVCESS
ncbi:MAG TPA: hypothetical protein VL282_02855 [Tepidisphaeraceae bacterium]|jgi:hypothetical protein|nr:hypothetical protein [Tepidisphaeraceae bacterium]